MSARRWHTFRLQITGMGGKVLSTRTENLCPGGWDNQRVDPTGPSAPSGGPGWWSAGSDGDGPGPSLGPGTPSCLPRGE